MLSYVSVGFDQETFSWMRDVTNFSLKYENSEGLPNWDRDFQKSEGYYWVNAKLPGSSTSGSQKETNSSNFNKSAAIRFSMQIYSRTVETVSEPHELMRRLESSLSGIGGFTFRLKRTGSDKSRLPSEWMLSLTQIIFPLQSSTKIHGPRLTDDVEYSIIPLPVTDPSIISKTDAVSSLPSVPRVGGVSKGVVGTSSAAAPTGGSADGDAAMKNMLAACRSHRKGGASKPKAKGVGVPSSDPSPSMGADGVATIPTPLSSPVDSTSAVVGPETGTNIDGDEKSIDLAETEEVKPSKGVFGKFL